MSKSFKIGELIKFILLTAESDPWMPYETIARQTQEKFNTMVAPSYVE